MPTTTTDLRARALAARSEMFERAAGRVERLDGASALFTPAIPRVRDLNVLRLEAAHDADAAEALAERVQGGLPHRYVEAADEDLAAALAPELERRGWAVDRILLMARPAGPPPAAQPVAEQVPYGFVRGLRAEWLRAELPAGDEDLLGQVQRGDALLFSATPTRAFAVFEDGSPVAYALLLDAGAIGMVEDVYTTPAARGRGFASAAVALALGASQAEGHEAAFLPTGLGGPAVALYERLGFAPLTVVHRFVRGPR